MRVILFFALCSVLLTFLMGCGGPSLTPEIVLENSLDSDVDKESLPKQNALNVKVYTELPKRSYIILDSFSTTFFYPKDSIRFRDIEKEKHIEELRRMAGKSGANAIIVLCSPQSNDWDEFSAWNVVRAEHLRLEQKTRVAVHSFAIYCQ